MEEGICRLLTFLVKRLRSTEQHQHNYYQSDFIRIHQLRAFPSRSDRSIHFIAELACLCSFQLFYFLMQMTLASLPPRFSAFPQRGAERRPRVLGAGCRAYAKR